MIRRPPRSTLDRSSAASDVYKRQDIINKDTFKNRTEFFSARRALKNKENDYGRNISIIMLK